MNLILYFVLFSLALGETYEVGSGQPYASIGAVPLDNLQPGDVILLHSGHYHEKFCLGGPGTAANPITLRGVPDSNGDLPIIDGEDAVTPLQLDYWHAARGVIHIGAYSTPSVATHIILENVEIIGAQHTNQFVDDDGTTGLTYDQEDGSGIFLNGCEHVTIRGCRIHGNRDGISSGFMDGATRDILIQNNHIWDNGGFDSIYEHNIYTSANGIVFEGNHIGHLCDGCRGSNLKDRSVGTVVRYNLIEGGSRQIDLVNVLSYADVHPDFDPEYSSTHVYGNILIEEDFSYDGQEQIVHYGGDSGAESTFRKGTLYFYNNNIVSRKQTLILTALQTSEESADVRNNIVYFVDPDSSSMDIIRQSIGTAESNANLYIASAVDYAGVTSTGSNPDIEATDCPWTDFVNYDYSLVDHSSAIGAAASLLSEELPVDQIYLHPCSIGPRSGNDDVGAYEDGDSSLAGSTDRLSGGEIAGIVVGSVVALLILVVALLVIVICAVVATKKKK